MCQKLQEVLSKSDRVSTGVRQLVVSGAFVRCCRCAGTPEVDLNKSSAKLRLKKKKKNHLSLSTVIAALGLFYPELYLSALAY